MHFGAPRIILPRVESRHDDTLRLFAYARISFTVDLMHIGEDLKQSKGHFNITFQLSPKQELTDIL